MEVKDEEKVYNIDDIPTNIGQGKLDSCLLVLYDWANGLTLDTMWRKESRGVDMFTDRRVLIEQLQATEVIDFMKHFLSQSHFTEVLMQPE